MLMVAFWDGCIFAFLQAVSHFPWAMDMCSEGMFQSSPESKATFAMLAVGTGSGLWGILPVPHAKPLKGDFLTASTLSLCLASTTDKSGFCLHSFTSTRVSLLPLVHIARASKPTNNIMVTARGKPLRCVHVCRVSQIAAHIVQEELNRSLEILSQNNKHVLSVV